MGYTIENVTVITWDDELKITKNATVKTDGSKISYVGSKADDINESITDIRIDGTGKVLIPGFVNAHTHIPMTLLRSYADDLNLQTWLFDHIFKIEDKLNDDDVYWGTQLGMLEMIAGGTTCFVTCIIL